MGLEVIAAVVSIGSAVYSASEQSRAADKQKKAARSAQAERETAAQKQERLESIQARRDTLSAVRESRIKRASLQAQAENLGVSGSSGALGGVSSIGAQLGSNIGFSETTAAFGKSIGQNMLQASRIETQSTIDMANSQSNIAMAGAIGGIAGQYADYSSLGKMFNTNEYASSIIADNGAKSFSSQLPSTSQVGVTGHFK